VTSWKYGIVAIITLFHDILITLGIFILLGRYLGLEVNTPFVAALLTILGYSVNDTIVVFDRIRENLHKFEGEFEEIVDKSVNETIIRSINTSLTTELVLLAILFFGGATIRDFVLVLVIGILLGTYSSIFIASPLLVVWQKIDWRLKKS
jgi:preprotein translocase subunit SecF